MSGKSWVVWGVTVGWAAFLVLSTIHWVEYQPQADEGFYLHYSTRVAKEGWAVFPTLFQEYLLGEPTHSYFPSPLRVTGLMLGGLAVRMGGASFVSLSLLSLLAFLSLLTLLYGSVCREWGERTAGWTGLLLSVAPLHLAMARRAISDTLISFLFVACLWVFWWALSGPKEGSLRRWGGVAFLYALTFLTKASAFVLIPISFCFLVWDAFRRKSLSVGFLAVSVIPLAIVLAVVVAATGSLEVLLQTIRFSQGAYHSRFAQLYLQGPWFRYVIDFLLISPWTTLLYLIGLGVLLGGRVKEARVWFWSLIPVLYLLCAAAFPLRNARYVMVLEVPVRLVCVFLLQRLFSREGKFERISTAAIGLVVLALMLGDLEMYRRFVLIDLYETPTITFLQLNHLLPRP